MFTMLVDVYDESQWFVKTITAGTMQKMIYTYTLVYRYCNTCDVYIVYYIHQKWCMVEYLIYYGTFLIYIMCTLRYKILFAWCDYIILAPTTP